MDGWAEGAPAERAGSLSGRKISEKWNTAEFLHTYLHIHLDWTGLTDYRAAKVVTHHFNSSQRRTGIHSYIFVCQQNGSTSQETAGHADIETVVRHTLWRDKFVVWAKKSRVDIDSGTRFGKANLSYKKWD